MPGDPGHHVGHVEVRLIRGRKVALVPVPRAATSDRQTHASVEYGYMSSNQDCR
jgi:hypothetical protein